MRLIRSILVLLLLLLVLALGLLFTIQNDVLVPRNVLFGGEHRRYFTIAGFAFAFAPLIK